MHMRTVLTPPLTTAKKSKRCDRVAPELTQFVCERAVLSQHFHNQGLRRMRHAWHLFRWVNLWPSAKLSRGVLSKEWLTNLSQEEDSSDCVFEETSLSDIGALVFLGNLGLFVAILLGIFIIHVVLASGVEAYWLSKVRLYFFRKSVLHSSPLIADPFSMRAFIGS